MAPAHQHVIIYFEIGNLHSVGHIKVSGLDAVQLEMLTNTFQMQNYQVSYIVGRPNTAITDILNYLSNTLGFELVSATTNERYIIFVMKK